MKVNNVGVSYFLLHRYWGRLGVYGGAAITCSTIVQGNTSSGFGFDLH